METEKREVDVDYQTNRLQITVGDEIRLREINIARGKAFQAAKDRALQPTNPPTSQTPPAPEAA